MTEHNPNGSASPVTAHQSPETREIYRLIMDVRMKMRGVISYLNAMEQGVFAPHPSRAELHETAEAIKTICALCLQTKDEAALRDLYHCNHSDAWDALFDYDVARGHNVSEIAEIITAMGEAQRIKSELHAAALIEDYERKRKAANTTDKTPLTSNKIESSGNAAALLAELVERGYIAPVNEVQAATWLYLWNLGPRPINITPLNWVENRGLLGIMIGAITYDRKIHKAAMWAFVAKGSIIDPIKLKASTSNAKNVPSGRGDRRRAELEQLIKIYTNGQ